MGRGELQSGGWVDGGRGTNNLCKQKLAQSGRAGRRGRVARGVGGGGGGGADTKSDLVVWKLLSVPCAAYVHLKDVTASTLLGFSIPATD